MHVRLILYCAARTAAQKLAACHALLVSGSLDEKVSFRDEPPSAEEGMARQAADRRQGE